MSRPGRLAGRGHLRGLVGTVVAVAALLPAGAALAAPGPSQQACDRRENNTYPKILECIRLGQVREHQAALQAIANANGGNRFSGKPGHDASAAYVAAKLRAAGYTVTVQNFNYLAYERLGPSVLQQIAPGAITTSKTRTSG